MIVPEGHYQSFWMWPVLFGGIGAVALLFWALDRVMKRYFPSSRKGFAAGGNALMRIEAIFLPGRQHVVEAQERDNEEQDESGDLPVAGDSGGR